MLVQGFNALNHFNDALGSTINRNLKMWKGWFEKNSGIFQIEWVGWSEKVYFPDLKKYKFALNMHKNA